jgi:hypothetical protein
MNTWKIRQKKEFNFYDTTFNVCEQYVSILLVKMGFFIRDPPIPVAIFIHERKNAETHWEFFSNIKLVRLN